MKLSHQISKKDSREEEKKEVSPAELGIIEEPQGFWDDFEDSSEQQSLGDTISMASRQSSRMIDQPAPVASNKPARISVPSCSHEQSANHALPSSAQDQKASLIEKYKNALQSNSSSSSSSSGSKSNHSKKSMDKVNVIDNKPKEGDAIQIQHEAPEYKSIIEHKDKLLQKANEDVHEVKAQQIIEENIAEDIIAHENPINEPVYIEKQANQYELGLENKVEISISSSSSSEISKAEQIAQSPEILIPSNLPEEIKNRKPPPNNFAKRESPQSSIAAFTFSKGNESLKHKMMQGGPEYQHADTPRFRQTIGAQEKEEIIAISSSSGSDPGLDKQEIEEEKPGIEFSIFQIEQQNQNPPIVRENSEDSMVEVESLTFIEALGVFKTLSLRNSNEVWKESTMGHLCGCIVGKHSLPDEIKEIVGKLIAFGESSFSMTQSFHRDLLASVLVKSGIGPLQTVDIRQPIDYFTKNQELELPLNIALAYPCSPLSLLFFLFILDYYPRKSEELIKSCQRMHSPCALLLVIMTLAKIFIDHVARQNINQHLKKKEQALEFCFFLFAGIVFEWFQMYGSNSVSWQNRNTVTKKIMAQVKSEPLSFVTSASRLYSG